MKCWVIGSVTSHEETIFFTFGTNIKKQKNTNFLWDVLTFLSLVFNNTIGCCELGSVM